MIVVALPAKFEGKQVELTTPRGDRLQFGREGSLLLNDEPLPLAGFKHYDNPYCICELGAPFMEIQHGGIAMRASILRARN